MESVSEAECPYIVRDAGGQRKVHNPPGCTQE